MNTLALPFPSLQFAKSWQEWKQYKKEQHRFTYKGEISEKAALKRLFELSSGEESIAITLIENAIGCGWKGIFPLKTNYVTGNTNHPKRTRHEAGLAGALTDIKVFANTGGIPDL